MPTDKPRAEFLLYNIDEKLTLNALLFMPEQPTRSAVVYVPGMTGGFVGPNDYNPMAARLNEIGYALMVPNMRTAGLHGMLYANFADYVNDIAAAMAVAKGRGLDHIALFGTSLGGPRIINYWRKTRDPMVKALGFVASIMSPYLEAQIRFDAKKKADFDAHLAKCRALIKAGRGSEILTYPEWFPGRDMVLAAHGLHRRIRHARRVRRQHHQVRRRGYGAGRRHPRHQGRPRAAAERRGDLREPDAMPRAATSFGSRAAGIFSHPARSPRATPTPSPVGLERSFLPFVSRRSHSGFSTGADL